DLLPLINPPPTSRSLAGKSDCARHLGGCLLARAPDLFGLMNANCLYETYFDFLSGSFSAPARSHLMYIGILWENMV
ncbi:MAG: hypothetical protein ABJD89_15310, partial [Paracoccaceae bacterium]